MELVKLKKLLKEITKIKIKGGKEVEITGICSNSKLVAPGNLFIAKKGLTYDGAQFIPEAVASGAVAIVTDMYHPFFPHIVQVIAEDVAAAEAQIAAEYYHHPSRQLCLIGVTGTNGKTTTSYLIKHVFDHSGIPCGLIGTIECIVGNHYFPSTQTTVDVITNNKLLHEMRLEGCQACVMEVSSHALAQERVRGLAYKIAVFTNLTQDHLDYHQTMEAYAEAKSLLFASLKEGHAVVNADCSFTPQMVQRCPSPALTYGIDNPCALRAANIRLGPHGTECTIHFKEESLPLKSKLIGRFNVYNLLAAIGVGLVRGLSLQHILDTLTSFPTVQGRLERVENKRGLNIFVDYAHTDDALINVLQTLKEIVPERIITVFGCGGNRDRGKRPKMAAAAEALSDIVIVTSDNPRTEDPMDIIAEILPGFKNLSEVHVVVDRAEAIRKAVSLCTLEDILLIAGKGHETYQIFSHGTVAFDDRAVAREAMQEHALDQE